ncbi:chromatin remodelling complex Rsc7/Swp82 subunit-domain-containing protein [Xylogone sp. PMI_703]|nr:chromatin remodelling complex Rsc7/Swp82 subunit-domain-containing protein [Xylogone sp. PMI_703]
MYSTQTNGLSAGLTDGTGTINPAALNSSGTALPNPPSTITPDTTPRGLKRSRSPPDDYSELHSGDGQGADDDNKPRKRGRPMKGGRHGTIPESPIQSTMPLTSQNLPPHTPQSQNTPLPTQLTNITPTQVSPPKPTPTKSVIKALPTVRDHTTDQLGPEGDEYIPREYDEAGEKKVTPTGHLLDGREYRCRTFFVPNRGDKLFMLATECARVLGYRDSYLLFNKNRSLYKIIASQSEKEDLIHQEILPFSYRSRQIAIVTAKSMFRQFGSRVIVNGRRVRDDYWESKARKQGFTEEDLAGEKRPGAAKARDAAAAEANANASLSLVHHGDVVYSNTPGHFVHPQQSLHGGMFSGTGSATTLPMITLGPDQGEMRMRDYSSVPRPRQEITGPAYQDRTQVSPPTDMLAQAHSAADYSKQINSQRQRSHEYLDRRWRQPHEIPVTSMAPPPVVTNDGLPATTALQSPRNSTTGLQQPALTHTSSQPLVAPQPYQPPPHQQNPVPQSPMRSVSQGTVRSDQLHGRSPSLAMGSTNLAQGSGQYGNFTPQNQMWAPSQPQPSPQHSGFPSYSPHAAQQSPHLQQVTQQAPPQLRPSASNPQMQAPLPYQGMQGLGQSYQNPSRGLYQADQSSHQYLPTNTSGPQPGAQWATQQTQGSTGNWGWTGGQQ